ncbi:MAG TPA: MerR family transcriptional regulator [Phycisphaerae bacterium]|nr:MerR family transcriptional regulator [Phycisphaerae bacterium]HPS53230.1 MerR family transcriptional regulator [Phycisphaerae bacterium]
MNLSDLKNDFSRFHRKPAAGMNAASRRRPPKLYRVGEVVEYSGVSRQTIHNYTTMGLIHTTGWTRGGHRLYDEGVFSRLDMIAEFKRGNRSMDFIRTFFEKMENATAAEHIAAGLIE